MILGLGLSLSLPGRRAGGPSQFTPTQTNMVGDWNPGIPATVTITGSGVSSLTNSGAGAGGALTQGTDANRPPIISGNLNGFDVMRFDGSNDVISGAFTNNKPLTYYLVTKQTTWGAGRVLVDGNASGTIQTRQNTGSPQLEANDGSGAPFQDGGLSLGTWGVVTFVHNGAAPNSMIRINKNAATTGTLTDPFPPGGITIGGLGGAFANVDVARLIVYSVAHNTTTQDTIIDGLRAQYGI